MSVGGAFVAGGGLIRAPAGPSRGIATNYSTQVWGRSIQVSAGHRAFTGVPLWASFLRNENQTALGVTTTTAKRRDMAYGFGYNLVPPDERGSLGLYRLWADDNLIWDAADPASSLPGLSFTLYKGEGDQVADGTVAADLGDLAPAFRDMIYIVIKDYPLGRVSAPANKPGVVTLGPAYNFNYAMPVIKAEFVDGLTISTGTTDFVMLDTSDIRPLGTLVDWDNDRLYAWQNYTTSAAELHIYSLSAQAELSKNVVSGTYTNINGAGVCALLDRANGTIVTHINGIGNMTPIALIDVASNSIVSTFGFADTNLAPADEFGADSSSSGLDIASLPWTNSGDICYLSQGDEDGTVIPVAVLGSTTEWVTPLMIDGEFPDALAPAGDVGDAQCGSIHIGTGGNLTFVTAMRRMADVNAALTVQDGAVIVGVGQRAFIMYFGIRDGDIKIFGLKQIADYGAGHLASACFIDPADGGIVIFEEVTATHVWTAYKYYVLYAAKAIGDMTSFTGIVGDKFKGTCPIVSFPHGSPISGTSTNPLYGPISIPAYGSSESAFGANRNANLEGGTFGWLSGTDAVVFNLNNGSHTTTPLAGISWSEWQWDSRTQQVYYPKGLTTHRNMAVAAINAAIGDDPTIGELLRWLALNAGYTDDQITVDPALTDPAKGCIVDKPYDHTALWAALGRLYDFQYFESDGGIKFSRAARGDGMVDPAYELDVSELAKASESTLTDNDAIVTTFAPPAEQAKSVSVSYYDYSVNYALSTQTYNLDQQTSGLVGTADEKIEVPIVMTTAEAFARVSKISARSIGENVVQEFRLPQRFSRLEPSDVLTIAAAPYLYTVRLDEVTFNADWSVSVSGINYAFDGAITVPDESNLGLPDDGHGYGRGDARPIALDIPYLSAAEALDAGFALQTGLQAYGQVTFTQAGFLQGPLPAGPFDLLYTSSHRAVYGVTVNALADTATPFMTDDTTILTVALRDGTSADFASTDADGLLNGLNALLIGDTDRWELVFFRDVVAVNDKVVKLSGLLRGRRGSDVHVGAHALSDGVILVRSVATDFVEPLTAVVVPVAKLSTVLRYRAEGQPASRPIVNVDVDIAGQSSYPWAPAAPAAAASGNDIILTWTRRDRLGTEFVTDPQPLSEASELYELDIMDGDTVARTVTGLTSPTYTYLDADQVTDGFTPPQASITVRIYQKSTITGRGFGRLVTLAVA